MWVVRLVVWEDVRDRQSCGSFPRSKSAAKATVHILQSWFQRVRGSYSSEPTQVKGFLGANRLNFTADCGESLVDQSSLTPNVSI